MKKKLRVVLMTLLTLSTLGAKAQTDVTSTYLKNADFEGATAITKGVCTYAKDTASNKTIYSSLQPVTDWTESVTGNVTAADGRAGAAYAYGGTPFLGGSGSIAPTVDNAGNTGNALGILNVWGSEGYYSQAVTDLPAGVYTLTVNVYNTAGANAIASRIGFVSAGGTATYGSTTKFTVGSWTKETVTFTLTEKTSGTITLGYKSNGSGSAANPRLFFDNLTLTYTDPKAALKDEITAATTLLGTIVTTSSDYTDLNTAIAAAQAVADDASATGTQISAAKTALEKAEKTAKLGFGLATIDNPVLSTLVTNGTFDSSTAGWTSTTKAQNSALAHNQTDAFTGNFWENWNGSAYTGKMYQKIADIPNGTYQLNICAFVNVLGDTGTQFVYANNDSTNLTKISPTAYSVITYVSNDTIEVGLKQTVAKANWMGIDNVSLTYYSKDNIVDAVKLLTYKKAWQAALANAILMRDSADYVNVTGEERTNIIDSINAYTTEPTTQAAYEAATKALTTATTTFVDAKLFYNYYVGAKSSAAEVKRLYPYASAEKYTAVDDSITAATAVAPVNAAEAYSKYIMMLKGVRNVVESNNKAEGITGALNCTDSIINHIDPTATTGWTQTSGSAVSVKNGESYTDGDGNSSHPYFDSNDWGNTTWTLDVNQVVKLPAGKYLLSVIGRGSMDMISYNLYAGTDSTRIRCMGNTDGIFDKGWNGSWLTFTQIADTGSVKIGVRAESTLIHQWLSYNDFKLYYIGDDELTAAIKNARAMLDTIADTEKVHLQAAIDSATTVKNTAGITAEQIADAIYMLKIAKVFAQQGFSSASLKTPVRSTLVVNGTFDNNINGWTSTTKAQNNALAHNQTGAFTGNFWENWNGSAYTGKMYQSVADVPNGTYQLNICAFVNTLGDAGTQFVYANDSTTNLTTGAPTAYTVVAYVSNDSIEFGLNQTVAKANWIGIDNVSLDFYSSENIVEKVKDLKYYFAWKNALDVAIAARDNADYASITGAERATLVDSITAFTTEPAADEAYTAAANALTNATTAFTAAKAPYDALVSAKALAARYIESPYPYASEAKMTALTAAVVAANAATDATDATTKAGGVYTAVRQYIESNNIAEGVTGATDYTSLILNAKDPANVTSWTNSGNTSITGTRSNESYTDGSGVSTHSYFDGGNWGGTAWTVDFNQTLNTLPEGKYILSVMGRAATNMTSFKLYADTTSVDIPFIGNAGGTFNGGWNSAYLVFEQKTPNTPIKLGVKAETASQYQWMSFNDFKLYRVTTIPVGINGINADGSVKMNIYNLNGQSVRTNASSTSGLGKGIYIINGRKVVVK